MCVVLTRKSIYKEVRRMPSVNTARQRDFILCLQIQYVLI